MHISIITKKDILPSVWDGGKTFQYFIFPKNAIYSERNFDFRISTATIEKSPSYFSKFDGYQRFLVMLDGDLEIIRNGNKENYLAKEIFSFHSSDEIQSFSKGSDFNLMINPELATAKLFLSKVFSASPTFVFVYAMENTIVGINHQKYMLTSGDLIFIDNCRQDTITIFSEEAIIIGAINGGKGN
jgi:environmental stress-induced protein Ves